MKANNILFTVLGIIVLILIFSRLYKLYQDKKLQEKLQSTLDNMRVSNDPLKPIDSYTGCKKCIVDFAMSLKSSAMGPATPGTNPNISRFDSRIFEPAYAKLISCI